MQRRLNLVLQELDRVNRDKSNLQQKFTIQDKEIGQMRRLIESDSDKDKVNAEIQMDVNGLRDGNVGIKHRITETDGSRADAI